MCLSNKAHSDVIKNQTPYLCFINYDYKNNLENFKLKNNNSLQFPEKLVIEVEKEIVFTDINFNVAFDNNTKIKLQQTISKEEYINKVNQLKQHIQQGDIYEINYCITFEAFDIEINPFEIYAKLNAISNAPYTALAKFDKQWIISASPELFLSKQQNTLITKPIKGTAKRGITVQEDDLLKQQLLHSKKERTENVMIVDVCRNDFSHVSSKGSVLVPKLFDIETYQQVHQMVSTVSCNLKPNTSFNDIIKATFPMASMTGAPKIRAMQLIDEYELYNRSAYSGTLGYISSDNNFDLSVLIRSIFYDEEKKHLSFSVGSAITSLCIAEEEYSECLLKAKAMITVLIE